MILGQCSHAQRGKRGQKFFEIRTIMRTITPTVGDSVAEFDAAKEIPNLNNLLVADDADLGSLRTGWPSIRLKTSDELMMGEILTMQRLLSIKKFVIRQNTNNLHETLGAYCHIAAQRTTIF
jgi:hypothetical protein